MKYKIEFHWDTCWCTSTESYTEKGGFWCVKYRRHWWNRWRYVKEDGIIKRLKTAVEAAKYSTYLKNKDYENRRTSAHD